jgi:hypothetical protein
VRRDPLQERSQRQAQLIGISAVDEMKNGGHGSRSSLAASGG